MLQSRSKYFVKNQSEKTVKAFTDTRVVVAIKLTAKPNTSAVRLREECEFDSNRSKDMNNNRK